MPPKRRRSGATAVEKRTDTFLRQQSESGTDFDDHQACVEKLRELLELRDQVFQQVRKEDRSLHRVRAECRRMKVSNLLLIQCHAAEAAHEVQVPQAGGDADQHTVNLMYFDVNSRSQQRRDGLLTKVGEARRRLQGARARASLAFFSGRDELHLRLASRRAAAELRGLGCTAGGRRKALEANPFEGQWKTSHNQVVHVRDRAVVFEKDFSDPIVIIGMSTLTMRIRMDGEEYRAIVRDGKLCWNDGDTWERVEVEAAQYCPRGHSLDAF